MTSKNENVLLWLYAYQLEATIPRNTVAATHPVFDFLTTFNDLQIGNVLAIVCISKESYDPMEDCGSNKSSVWTSNDLKRPLITSMKIFKWI